MEVSEVVYRSAAMDDLDSIMDLWLESVDYHEALDSRMALNKEAIENVRTFYSNKYFKDDSILEIASVDGIVVGVCGAFIQETPPIHFERLRGFIDIAFVSKKFRHHGIGTVLFERVLNWLKSKDLVKIRLYVASRNPIGVSFWRKMGFDDMMQIMEMKI
jgi:GNAT superfamily N-acetyltransferase